MAAVVLIDAVESISTGQVSLQAGRHGLDVHEHGMLAYPEYVIHGYGQPHFVPTGQPAARAVGEARPEPAR